MSDLYTWPTLQQDLDDKYEKQWAEWAYAVQDELQPVYEAAFRPLPDEPTLIDHEVTQNIDGWLPRVASLAVKAEFFLAAAKGLYYPRGLKDPDTGKPLTVSEKDAMFEARLAGFRFVRDELEQLTRRLAERVRWSQSVRKPQGDAQ